MSRHIIFYFVPGIHLVFSDCSNRFRSDEEEQNSSLQDRVKSLHWVTQGFFETTLDFTSAVVSPSFRFFSILSI